MNIHAEAQPSDHCPVCQASDAQTFPVVFKRHPCQYLQCPSCHTMFQSPMPTVAEMMAYADMEYSDGAYKAYVQARPMKIATFKNRLSTVADRLSPIAKGRPRHLDVGCSAGFMIEVGLDAGFDSYGVEFSKEAIKLADPKIQNRITPSDVNQLINEGTEKFDLITCFDIVEHVQNPLEFLRSLRQLLNPEGRLLLTTPDVEHLIAKAMGSRWPMLQPKQHTILFSKKSLEKVLMEAGFNHVLHYPAKKTISYRYMTGQLAELNPLLSGAMKALGWIIPNALKNKPLMINISEFMTLAH
jgi:2-polyprenyl-3-methyl-5-hydroxy-6-metoxy-1,4-benzoquinol methylase